MKYMALALLGALVLSAPAVAEEKTVPEIVAHEGIAFSRVEGEKDAKKVIAYDVVSAWNNRQPQVADCDKYDAKLKGVTWCFASAANKAAFVKATDKKDGDNKFLPFVGGRCALGTSWGRLASEGDPRTARIIESDLGPVLVLQSAQKWWPVFEKEMFTRMQFAQMRFDFGKRVGDITPNTQEANTAQK